MPPSGRVVGLDPGLRRDDGKNLMLTATGHRPPATGHSYGHGHGYGYGYGYGYDLRPG